MGTGLSAQGGPGNSFSSAQESGFEVTFLMFLLPALEFTLQRFSELQTGFGFWPNQKMYPRGAPGIV